MNDRYEAAKALKALLNANRDGELPAVTVLAEERRPRQRPEFVPSATPEANNRGDTTPFSEG